MHGISFIIPTYNKENLTLNCIKSIVNLNDLKDISYEIIVVDDHSNDFIFKKLGTSLKLLNLHNLIILRNEKNMGPSYTRNHGAKKSKYNYLFFLDSDTEILEGGISNFLKKIIYNDAVVGIYDLIPLNRGHFSLHKAYLNYFHSYSSDDYKFDDFAAACAGIKKEVFNKLNGFDENIKWGMDYECEEFGYRINKNGYKLIASSKTKIRHHFPNGIQAIKLYYIRVSNWIAYYFNIKKNFTRTKATTPLIAIGCISSLFSTLLTIGIFIFSNVYLSYLLTFFLFVYLFVFFKFFIFIFKNNIKMFVSLFSINYIISNIIAFSSFVGFLKFITKKVLN